MTFFTSNENTTNNTKRLPSVKVQLVRNLDFQRQKLVDGGEAKNGSSKPWQFIFWVIFLEM